MKIIQSFWKIFFRNESKIADFENLGSEKCLQKSGNTSIKKTQLNICLYTLPPEDENRCSFGNSEFLFGTCRNVM